VKQQHVKEGTSKHQVHYQLLLFLQNESDGALKEIYNKIILQKEKDMPGTTREGIRRLCTEPKQTLMANDFVMASVYYMEYQCDVTKLPRTAIPGSLSFAISKENPYRKLFNYK
jgi:hypothetical protein